MVAGVVDVSLGETCGGEACLEDCSAYSVSLSGWKRSADFSYGAIMSPVKWHSDNSAQGFMCMKVLVQGLTCKLLIERK